MSWDATTNSVPNFQLLLFHFDLPMVTSRWLYGDTTSPAEHRSVSMILARSHPQIHPGGMSESYAELLRR